MAKITINKKIRFGKPIIEGTRITVDEVLGALAGGMTYEEIEEEYDLTKEDILAALLYATKIIAEEKVGIVGIEE